MFTNYEKIIVSYEELQNLELIYENPFLLTVDHGGVPYEFFMRLTKKTSHLLVFGSGAYNPEKMKPPVFQRHSWTQHFDDSIIFYNDPTLYIGPLSLGWGHGTTERFYLEDIAAILQEVMKKMEIHPEETLFYGSSGGGFMSLILAGFVKGARALVNNPQTIIPNYYATHVNRLFQHAHPSLGRDEIISRFANRLNVLEFYKTIGFVPNIYYLQNAACDHDMQKHVLPFITGLNELPDASFHQVQFEFYSDKERGHTPLETEDTVSYVRKISRLATTNKH